MNCKKCGVEMNMVCIKEVLGEKMILYKCPKCDNEQLKTIEDNKNKKGE